MGVEQWRSIPEFSNYEISSHGRLRSKDKYVTYASSQTDKLVTQFRKGRILNGAPDVDGYLRTALVNDAGIKQAVRIHRLVAIAFLDISPRNKNVVMHLDDNITNNHHRNLQWGSTADNHADRDRKGRQARGSRQGLAVFTEKEVLQIAQLYKSGHTAKQISKIVSGNYCTIWEICAGNTWSHLTGLKPRSKNG